MIKNAARSCIDSLYRLVIPAVLDHMLEEPSIAIKTILDRLVAELGCSCRILSALLPHCSLEASASSSCPDDPKAQRFVGFVSVARLFLP